VSSTTAPPRWDGIPRARFRYPRVHRPL
jgi:hypothetical protein